jgi:O-antigen ligase
VAYLLIAPAVVWAVRATGHYGAIEHAVPLSWSMRMTFWSHTVDWIGDHPLRGWGLDASRMFGPGIVLHPHDDALQLWLELGVLGVLLAAGIWWSAVSRLARAERDIGAAAVTASAGVYLLFGALNFGVWQEWWLALAALIAVAAALMAGGAAPSRAST